MAQKRDIFEIEAVNDCIVISGNMNGLKSVRNKINAVLKTVASAGIRKVLVVAHKALLHPDGVVAWADAAETHLPDFTLYYSTSQLGTILQFDEAYTHKHSEYEFPLCAPQECHSTSAPKRAVRGGRHEKSVGSHAFA